MSMKKCSCYRWLLPLLVSVKLLLSLTMSSGFYRQWQSGRSHSHIARILYCLPHVLCFLSYSLFPHVLYFLLLLFIHMFAIYRKREGTLQLLITCSDKLSLPFLQQQVCIIQAANQCIHACKTCGKAQIYFGPLIYNYFNYAPNRL